MSAMGRVEEGGQDGQVEAAERQTAGLLHRVRRPASTVAVCKRAHRAPSGSIPRHANRCDGAPFVFTRSLSCGACPTQEAHLPRKFGPPLGLPPLTRCVGADGPTTCAIVALPALLPARAHGPWREARRRGRTPYWRCVSVRAHRARLDPAPCDGRDGDGARSSCSHGRLCSVELRVLRSPRQVAALRAQSSAVRSRTFTPFGAALAQ